MKKMLLLVAVFVATVSQWAQAQEKWFTKAGHITFLSKSPLENIEAQNKKVTCVVNATTGQIEFAVLMKAFEFKKALMEEHFNENYVESDKFPKGTFKGQIDNIKEVNFKKNGTYPTTVSGSMTIHGETKAVTAKGTITIKDGKAIAKSDFNLLLSDYKIAIPAAVKDNLSDKINIGVNVTLEPLK